MANDELNSQAYSLARVIARSLFASRPYERRLRTASEWALVLGHCSLSLCGVSTRILETVDLARIDDLALEMGPVLEQEATSAAKYADYGYWIPFNVSRAGVLGLHKSPPLRILDIGCGPGYFLAAARACGHQCYGVDAPAEILSVVERRVYSEVLVALSCQEQVSSLLIERFVPMSLPYTDLDLITAFWICFNRHRRPDEWGVAEWRFFVDDALGYLKPGGVLRLELNANPEHFKSLRFFDSETLEFFRSQGSVVGGIVRMRKGSVVPIPKPLTSDV